MLKTPGRDSRRVGGNVSEHESVPESWDDRAEAAAAKPESSAPYLGPDAGDTVGDRDAIRKRLERAKREYEDIGGWNALASGEWLWILIERSFKDYWERANVEYFCSKYGTTDPEKVSAKLVSVASRNAALLGAVTGAAVSADEIYALLKAAKGKGGLSLPANLAVAATAIGGEAVLLMRLQLQLVANLGKLYGVPLDPDDPEDILTIIAFAIGGSAAEAAGKAGVKIGGKLGGRAAKAIFSKELLATLKRVGAKAGIKILQRTIVQFAVPLVSIGIGLGWNYTATKAVSRLAIRHFQLRKAELTRASQPVQGAAPSVSGLSASGASEGEDDGEAPGIGYSLEPDPDSA